MKKITRFLSLSMAICMIILIAPLDMFKINASAADSLLAYYEVVNEYKDKNGKIVKPGYGLAHKDHSGSSTKIYVPLGTLCKVDKIYKNSEGKNWYHYTKSGEDRWIYYTYVDRLGTISSDSKKVVTIQSCPCWDRPCSDETSMYAKKKSFSPFAAKTVLTVTETITNKKNKTWYKVKDASGNSGFVFKDNVKDHNSCTWNSGTVTKAATCTATGTKKYTCTACGKTKTETISALGHNYKNGKCTRCSAWTVKSTSTVNNEPYIIVTDSAKVHDGPYGACKTVATLNKKTQVTVTQKIVNGEGNTWYKYSGGYISEKNSNDVVQIKKHTSCIWNSGTVTKSATCTAPGSKKFTCTLCGKTKTETIPALGHNYKTGVCTRCKAWKVKSSTNMNNVNFYVTKEGAAVHDGPYGACATVGSLSKGTKIIVTQKVENYENHTWYKYSDGYILGDYVAVKYTIKYDANGGTNAPKATGFLSGETAKITSSRPKRTGYIFKGWATSMDSTSVSYKAEDKYSAKKSITLYAVWSKCTSHTYKNEVCTKCGYQFKYKIEACSGTYNAKNKNGTKVMSKPNSSANSVLIDTLPYKAEVTVIAKTVNASNNTWYQIAEDQWIYSKNLGKLYTIKYNANDGTSTPQATQFFSGETAKITSSKPKRAGYIFKGWATSKDSSTVSYTADTSYSTKKNITLYAVWSKCTSHTYKNEVCTKCGYQFKYKIEACSGRYIAKNKSGTKVMSKPNSSTTSIEVMKLDYGTVVSVIGKTINASNNTWYQISEDQWIYSKNLKSVNKVKYTQTRLVSDSKKRNDINTNYAKRYFEGKGVAKDSWIIPGLKENENMVPQGIAYYPDKNQVLITAYYNDGTDTKKPSMIFALDYSTGELVNEYKLKFKVDDITGHVGGIAVSGKNIYVANGKYIYLFEADNLKDGTATSNARKKISGSVKGLSEDASCAYVSISDNVLWTGNFYDSDDSKYKKPADSTHNTNILGFKLTGSGDSSEWSSFNAKTSADYLYSLPNNIENIQYATVTNNKMVMISSFGRKNDSTVYFADLSGVSSLMAYSKMFSVKGLPMMEGFFVKDGYMYNICESGAYFYNGYSKTNKSKDPTDVVWEIKLQPFFDKFGKQ